MKSDLYNQLLDEAIITASKQIKGGAHKNTLKISRDGWNAFFTTDKKWDNASGSMTQLPMICISTYGISHKNTSNSPWETDVSKEEIDAMSEDKVKEAVKNIFALWGEI